MNIGDTINRWTLIELCPGGRYQYGIFRCSCGQIKRILLRNVVVGASKSCGCYRREMAAIAIERINIVGIHIGDKINRLTLLHIPGDQRGPRRGLFRCDCGAEKYIKITSVKTGKTKSCGCLSREVRRNLPRNYFKLPEGEAALNRLYYIYRRAAYKRGHEFDLTIDQFRQLTSNNCFYCGCPPSKLYQDRTCWSPYKYNGIDRYDNRLGYNVVNCVTCCSTCNFSKHKMSADEFINHCKKIVEYRDSRR